MRTVTDRFLPALRTSHRIATRVDVLFAGEVVVEDVPVLEGRVDYDSRAAVLARLDITLADPVRLPTQTPTPYGFELAVWRGIRYLTEELVPLGVFPIQTADIDGVTLLTRISAMDRAQQQRDARFEEDYQIAAGTNYATAIRDMLEDGVSGGVYAFVSTGYTTPLLTHPAQGDRWEAAQKMARSISCELFFDGLGHRVLRREPDLRTATPVWTVDEGDDGVLTGIGLHLDRATAYNRVVAFGENASLTTVPRGVATDDDPSSPTYYFGPFGHKPRFYASPFISSDAQAVSAANAILSSNLGVSRSIDFMAVPNPALEAGDPILVRRAALGIDEVHIVDTLTVGLGATATMGGQSRARQEAA